MNRIGSAACPVACGVGYGRADKEPLLLPIKAVNIPRFWPGADANREIVAFKAREIAFRHRILKVSARPLRLAIGGEIKLLIVFIAVKAGNSRPGEPILGIV